MANTHLVEVSRLFYGGISLYSCTVLYCKRRPLINNVCKMNSIKLFILPKHASISNIYIFF